MQHLLDIRLGYEAIYLLIGLAIEIHLWSFATTHNQVPCSYIEWNGFIS